MSLVVFYIIAGAILISALMVVLLRNVFHSALFLVLTFFLVAGIYLMLKAHFLAAVQVLIYVGAVTILVLFAIMLTQKLQSGSIRQVNEKVIPAAVIAALFMALAIIAMAYTFGVVKKQVEHIPTWTASLDLSDLPPSPSGWSWTVDIEDGKGESYVAGGFFSISGEMSAARVFPVTKSEGKSGYLLSSKADFSTADRMFAPGQTVYIKVWSDKVDQNSIVTASWKIFDMKRKLKIVGLSAGNVGRIGQLLMSKFVLPFEVVSVLLLAALIGAIVIARKDS